MERVIVTGASGFIGRNLVDRLLEKGYQIIALDVFFSEEFKSNPRIDCIDVRKEDWIDNLENYPEKAKIFFQLAWQGTSGELRSDYEIQLNNVKLTCDYVKVAKKLGCSRFIYASSINEMETYEYLQFDDIKPSGGYIYGTGKLAAHLMAETVAYSLEIEFIPIIITNIYGVGEKSARLINSSIRKLLKGEHCSFTAGSQMYDFIYITDAINSIVEVSEKGNAFNRYYIGSGEPKPLKDFLLQMKDIVAPEVELGLGDIPFNGINLDYSQFILDKVYQDTGYKNQYSFAEGIKLTMDYIKSEDD